MYNYIFFLQSFDSTNMISEQILKKSDETDVWLGAIMKDGNSRPFTWQDGSNCKTFFKMGQRAVNSISNSNSISSNSISSPNLIYLEKSSKIFKQ